MMDTLELMNIDIREDVFQKLLEKADDELLQKIIKDEGSHSASEYAKRVLSKRHPGQIEIVLSTRITSNGQLIWQPDRVLKTKVGAKRVDAFYDLEKSVGRYHTGIHSFLKGFLEEEAGLISS